MTAADAARAATLQVGLQEWAVCCRALAAGRSLLIVRKGGIHERGGGLFRPEHERFLLLPTYLHQAAERLRPAYAGDLAAAAADPAPGTIAVAAWAEVAATWKAVSLERVQALGDELIWTGAELAARFAYRDQPWLYVLALRCRRLGVPAAIPDEPAYAGCRSWVPLKAAVAIEPSAPAVDDAAFAARLARVRATLEAA